MDLVWWQCPRCNNINSYTQNQLRNRKLCPPCSYQRKKVVSADKRSIESRDEFWDAGFLCQSCGKRYWVTMRNGGYPKRCHRCRNRRPRV